MFLEILQNFGIIALVISATAWLVRELFKQILNRDIEKFKSDLEKESTEFKIRYEKLHGERVMVIKEVYKKIVKTYKSFHSLINPFQLAGEPSHEEKGKVAAENANDLTDFYEENRIFFDEKLAEHIDFLLKDFRDAWNKLEYSRESRKSGDYKISLDEWNSAWKQIKDKVPIVKKELENKFREILGIKNEK